jgi:hypothetical protein
MKKKHRAEVIKALPLIEDFLESSSKKVYKRAELGSLLTRQRLSWNIFSSVGVNNFVQILLEKTELKKIELTFPNRNELRFLWKGASVYELALSLREDSYLSHSSAVYQLGLADNVPKDIYINYEQPKRANKKNELSQEGIDAALQKPVRVTSNKAQHDDNTIWILNGMYTGCLGVIEIEGSNRERLLLTDIERTLIDIAVRPVYSGGVLKVFRAYQLAIGRVSVEKIEKTLRTMNHTYPYHQVVGFYLERAGTCDESSLARLSSFGLSFDFYLTHQMAETEYSKKWRLYYPAKLFP